MDNDLEFDEIIDIDDVRQYLFFKAGGDIYAIEAHNVSEMVEYQSYTKVPHMPSYVKGVTNIRGNIICVIDLLNRLELGEITVDKRTSLIVINDIAFIIDEVHEVGSIQDDAIKASLDFGFKIKQRFIKNMARYEDDYIAILNCDEILNIEEISQVEAKQC